MSEYDYADFNEMENVEYNKKYVAHYNIKRKYNAREFLLKLFEERPYTRAEIDTLGLDADLNFAFGMTDSERSLSISLNELLTEGIVKAKYDKNGRVYYGIPDSRKYNEE